MGLQFQQLDGVPVATVDYYEKEKEKKEKQSYW